MVTPVDPRVEFNLGGWTDVTDYVYERDSLTISRGRSSEASRVDPSTCKFTLNNRDGRFSPRNPLSPYYGVIGRNTPCRVSVPYGETYLYMLGTANDKVTTPDSAALSITGDIDIRADVTLFTWRNGQDFAGKYETTGNNRSWAFTATDDGFLQLLWSPDGTLAARLDATSTVAIPISRGRLAVRATLDVNDGAGGRIIRFYTAPTMSGSWTQLGATINVSGATSIFDSNAQIELGEVTDLTSNPLIGMYHSFELRNGIGGTVVANPDFSIQTPGDGSFPDTATSPNTWAVEDQAFLTDRIFRFWGEVSAWPQRWDISGRDVYVTVEAAGVLRRLGQGASPLNSVMKRSYTDVGIIDAVAYWPMEDAEGSTSIASVTESVGPMKILGTPDLAQDETFYASKALPKMGTASMAGTVPTYTTTNDIQVRLLMKVPDTGITSGSILLSIQTTGTVRRWEVYYSTGGSLGLRGFDADGTSIADTGLIGFDVDGRNLRISVEINPSGGGIRYEIVMLEQGDQIGLAFGTTLGSSTVGRVSSVKLAPNGDLADVVFGHLGVQDAITSIYDLSDELNAYNSENPRARLNRLLTEEDVTFIGTPEAGEDNDTTMGRQGVKSLLDLAFEVADTDMGLLYEPMSFLGLGYRTRLGLYNQTTMLELDYSQHELADSLNPIDDDTDVRNDVTVSRDKGSSARAVLETGSMSVLAPPNGVGRYQESVTISLGMDAQLPFQAGWRLMLGTIDEPRYPSIVLNLRHPTWDDQTLFEQFLFMDIGDKIEVINPPPWLPPDDINLLVQGWTEQMTGHTHVITVNCSPEGPFHVGYADDEVLGRADTDGSELAEALTTTETDVDVATTSGPLWTTDGAEFPFDVTIGGEVMTVTAISGASSPQTFTVTRSVNGVVKTHASGADVRLTHPMILSL